MMMLMLRRRRKRRKMMLRRKTDPKTGSHTLCEPARSKCIRAFHKIHFVSFGIEIYKKNGRGHLRGHRFVRAWAVERHIDI